MIKSVCVSEMCVDVNVWRWEQGLSIQYMLAYS